MLNSDGEIEEDQETHVERHARTVRFAQVGQYSLTLNKGMLLSDDIPYL